MELKISERINRFRKDKNITQEELAGALGVSSQAVSNWERGGYPDITLLPVIARFFGVTIDELMGNDADSQKEDKDNYYDLLRASETPEDRVSVIIDYMRKYPNELTYCHDLGWAYVRGWANADDNECDKMKSKYAADFESAVSRLLASSDAYYLTEGSALRTITCPESELNAHVRELPIKTRRNALIDRARFLRDSAAYQIQYHLNTYEEFANMLDTRCPDEAGPTTNADFQRKIIALIEAFSENGRLPEGWLLFRGYKKLVLSACLFGSGDMDEGWRAFAEGMDDLKKWYPITKDDPTLPVGDNFFGGLRVHKDLYRAVAPDGTTHKLYNAHHALRYHKASDIYSFLICPRWAWFDSARSDPRYTAALDWVKSLADAEE